jgi:hypothetical protein
VRRRPHCDVARQSVRAHTPRGAPALLGFRAPSVAHPDVAHSEAARPEVSRSRGRTGTDASDPLATPPSRAMHTVLAPAWPCRPPTVSLRALPVAGSPLTSRALH